MKKRTRFVPRPGQVDFTNIRWAPVVNSVLKYRDKILIVQRDHSMRLYPGYWNDISGFLDDKRSLEQKVKQELKEETGINAKQIISIQLGAIFDQEEPKYKKTWIVHPVLVKVRTNKITLDWEATNYQWIKPAEATKFDLLPGFDRVLKAFHLI